MQAHWPPPGWSVATSSGQAWLQTSRSGVERAKVTSQLATLVEKMEILQQSFSHVHVDLVGPLPTPCAGHWYLLTIIDRSSRWLAAETVLEAFITSWVARFGVVQRVTSDAIHMRHVDQLV